VNGKKVNEHQLKPGDKISFDKSVFLVAGPVGEVAAASFLEDEEEATMFRAVAPMPKAPPPKIQSAASAPTQQVEGNVSAVSDESKSGKGGMIAIGVIVVAVVAAVVGYIVIVGI